jgi:mRNA interferase MazF
MTTFPAFRRGDVVLLTFPFTSGAGGKSRPALVVLDTGDADVVLARVTTRRYATGADVPLAHWRAAGLAAPSVARLHKVVTVDKALVSRTLGTLDPVDVVAVAEALKQLYS